MKVKNSVNWLYWDLTSSQTFRINCLFVKKMLLCRMSQCVCSCVRKGGKWKYQGCEMCVWERERERGVGVLHIKSLVIKIMTHTHIHTHGWNMLFLNCLCACFVLFFWLMDYADREVLRWIPVEPQIIFYIISDCMSFSNTSSSQLWMNEQIKLKMSSDSPYRFHFLRRSRLWLITSKAFAKSTTLF